MRGELLSKVRAPAAVATWYIASVICEDEDDDVSVQDHGSLVLCDLGGRGRNFAVLSHTDDGEETRERERDEGPEIPKLVRWDAQGPGRPRRAGVPADLK